MGTRKRIELVQLMQTALRVIGREIFFPDSVRDDDWITGMLKKLEELDDTITLCL